MVSISRIGVTQTISQNKSVSFQGMIGSGSERERIAVQMGHTSKTIIKKGEEQLEKVTSSISKKVKDKKRTPTEQTYHNGGLTRLDRLRSSM